MRAILLLFATALFGQTPVQENVDRVLHFTNNQTVQDMQEIATVIRSIAAIRQASADPAQQSLTLSGTAVQIAASEWLFNQLDQAPDTVVHEYKMSGDDIVRLFYLPHAATVQELQEEVTLVRSMADVRRLFTYNAPRAAVLRGTATQMSLAEWLFTELDKPANRPGAHEFLMPGGEDDVVRLMYLPSTRTVQDFQEVVTLVRSMGRIRKVFTYNASRAVTLRGTGEQMALADWLFQELETPRPAVVQPGAAHEYHMPSDADDVVRVFYLTHAGTPQRLQEIGVQVRTSTDVHWLFTYNAPNAIALRGTSAQIAMADRLIQERDR